MKRLPPISDASKVPITALLCGGAIAVSLWSMNDRSIVDKFALHGDVPLSQAWKLVTTILPHGNPAHLIFNLYWVWALGPHLERAFGHARYLGFVILAAAISSGPEWLFLSGGIGLSGVVYAMFGVLWALRARPGYAGIVDRRTVHLFIAWFFVCIGLTYAGIMAIANIAHAMGLVVGLVVGEGIKHSGMRRAAWACVTGAMLALIGAGWQFRESVKLANAGPGDVRKTIDLATRAIREGRTNDAVRHMEEALKSGPEIAQWWYVLAIEYHKAGRMDDALRAAREAARLEPKDASFGAYVRQLEQGETREQASAEVQPDDEAESESEDLAPPDALD